MVEGQLEHVLVVAEQVEVVSRLQLAVTDDVHVPAECEAERLVERAALLGVGDAQHGVEIGSHACILSRLSQTTPRSKVMTSLRISPVLGGQQHLARGDIRLGGARVAGLGTPIALAVLDDAQLVVGWLSAIRLGDCNPAVERPDGDAPEFHLRVVVEPRQHGLPVTGAHAGVEVFDVLSKKLAQRRDSTPRGPPARART